MSSEEESKEETEFFQGRGPIGAEFTGPGPFAYFLPTTIGTIGHTVTKERAPAFSICSRHYAKVYSTPGPYGCVIGVTRRGRQKAPAYTITGRLKPLAVEHLPGPGHYAAQFTKYGILSTQAHSPAFSFGARNNLESIPVGPSSSQYSLPDSFGKSTLHLKTAPAWTLHSRHDYGSLAHEAIKNNFPSPSSYSPVNLNVIKTSSRACKITGRLPLASIARANENPGPGAYDPLPPSSRCLKGFTMGIKHSDYIVPYTCELDAL